MADYKFKNGDFFGIVNHVSGDVVHRRGKPSVFEFEVFRKADHSSGSVSIGRVSVGSKCCYWGNEEGQFCVCEIKSCTILWELLDLKYRIPYGASVLMRPLCLFSAVGSKLVPSGVNFYDLPYLDQNVYRVPDNINFNLESTLSNP